MVHRSPRERSEWWGGSTRTLGGRRGGGCFRKITPHPGLRFASAFPPRRFAEGGIRGRSPPQGGREPPAAMAGINLITIDYFAGAGVGLKSTFGAVEISFSLSTVKLAFSL